MDINPLDREIEAFNKLLPKLRSECGDVWAVISGEAVRGCFGTFGQAADFAVGQLRQRTYLIRHTSAAKPHIPYIAIDG